MNHYPCCERCLLPLYDGSCTSCGAVDADFSSLPTDDRPADQSSRTDAPDVSQALARTPSGRSAATDQLPYRGLQGSPGGYRIESRLGQGGMGDVYLAFDLELEKHVALKFLRGDGRKALARFKVESRAMALVDHPNVVRILATDLERAEPYFAMEHVPGGTLSAKVGREGPLPPLVAATLIAAVARGVQAAHDRGVLHRDLKGANILIASDGTPKVTDFGLAKRLDRDDGLTVNPDGMGTPSYMAPEQISGTEGDACFATDVYGLGATLFFVLTGQPPFTGKTRDEIMRRVRTELPPRPRTLRSEIPAALEAIVLKALEKKPGKRYTTAAELAADLDRFVTHGTSIAPAATRLRRVRQRVSPRRWAIPLVASVLAVGLVLAGKQLGLTSTPTPGEEMRRDLAAGKTVEPLNPDGAPRHSRSLLIHGTPGSEAFERVCSFSAVASGMLELMPAPGVDRYTVDFKLKHKASNGNAFNGVDSGGVGFYFGHLAVPAPDGTLVHIAVAPFLSDADFSSIRENRAIRMQRMELCGLVLSHRPDGDILGDKNHIFRGLDFMPTAAVPPGIWRRFTLDIDPEGFVVRYRPEDEDPREVIRLTSAEVQDYYLRLGRGSERDFPGTGVRVPPWSPNLPMGLYVLNGTVSVKDLTVVPRTESPKEK